MISALYLKGLDHEINIFLGGLSKYQYILCMRLWFICTFPTALLKIKINEKFLLASMKTLTNSKNCLESCIRISVLAFLLSHWSISPVY
jgi:hypothetical protein